MRNPKLEILSVLRSLEGRRDLASPHSLLLCEGKQKEKRASRRIRGGLEG